MHKELINWLRDVCIDERGDEAADLIEQLQRENEELKSACDLLGIVSRKRIEDYQITALRAELAASQAQNIKLRDALESIKAGFHERHQVAPKKVKLLAWLVENDWVQWRVESSLPPSIHPDEFKRIPELDREVEIAGL